jgi:hypothetical protein
VIIGMSARFMPYASTPGRATIQVAADVCVVLWVILWVFVGRAVHTAITAIAEVGRRVEGGANGIAGNLDSAGDSAGRVPLIGDPLSAPLRAAGDAARNIAGAGAGLYDKATWLAMVLALAVAIPPVLGVVVPWLLLRLRFARRAGAAADLARTPGGEQLLALRALANRPLARLTAISPDPVQAWREGDPVAVRELAAMELRSAGIRVPRTGRPAITAEPA